MSNVEQDRVGKVLERLALALQESTGVDDDESEQSVFQRVLEEHLLLLLLAGHNSRYAALGHSHWDDTMQHGAGCQLCIDRRAANEAYDAALAAAQGQPEKESGR